MVGYFKDLLYYCYLLPADSIELWEADINIYVFHWCRSTRCFAQRGMQQASPDTKVYCCPTCPHIRTNVMSEMK